MRAVALFDVDNTLYHGFSFTGLLEQEVSVGILESAVLDACTQTLQDYKNGMADYEQSVGKVLALHATGLKGKRYEDVYHLAVTFYKDSEEFYDFAVPVIAQLSATHDVVLVTAEPRYAAQAILDVVGANSSHHTEYEVVEGIFTGNIVSTLATRHDKHQAIQETMSSHAHEQSFAFGDSEGDIEMLKAVEHAICINASDGLLTEARTRNWHIVEPDNVRAFVTGLL